MKPTADFFDAANKRIRATLESLRPQLLAGQGSIEHKLKDDKTVVTAMDTLVEDRLRAALGQLDGGVGFGGEESGVDYNQQTFWLVDPIDGTEPFIRGLPFGTCMLALIDNSQPIMSVIYNFALDEYFLAIRGQGATRNGHPIHVSNRPMSRAWVTLSARQDMPGTAGLSDTMARRVHAARRYGGAGFEYSQVACGAIEGRVMFRGHGQAWDFAPGALLVMEAGGRAANIGSDTYNYRNYDHVISSAIIFDDLMNMMNEWQATHPASAAA